MAKVSIHSEGQPAFEVALGAFTTIGRRRDQRVQLMDELVSKQHAVLFRKGSDVYVRDVGSSNGTFVNGERVTDDVCLANDDRVALGNTEIIYQEEQRAKTSDSVRLTEKPPSEGTVIFRKLTTSKHDGFRPAEAVENPQELKRDYDKLRLAFMLSQQLRNVADQDELFSKVLAFMFHHLQADRVAVLDKNLVTGEWEVIARRSILGDIAMAATDDEPEDFEISSTLLEEVVERGEAVLSYDATVDSRFSGAQSLILQGVKAIVCVPIHVNATVEFLLYLDSINRGVFTEQDLEVLETFATYAGMALENLALIRRVKEDAETRANLERLMSPNLVDKVVSGELEVRKGGQEQDISVLFLDIRNFVGYTENKRPEAVITFLNELFELMVEVIFYHGGTLDKYIGDCIMAFWGAPIDVEDHAYKAVLAAKQMMDIANEYSASLERAGEEPFKIGIGLNTDRMVAGYVGATRTMSYTVIGKGVNLAARLCSQAKGGEILLAPNTFLNVRDRVDARVVGESRIKGLSQPVWVYRLREIF